MNRKLVAILAAVPAATGGGLLLATAGGSVAAKAPAKDYIEGRVTSGRATPEAGVW